MMGGGTRIHEFVGKPGNEFVIRTWNWDAGPKGFGEKMVDYLIKTAHPKKVAMLFQNDSGGKILGDIYEPIFKARGIETMTEYFEPGTKDFSPVLAKIGRIPAGLSVPRLLRRRAVRHRAAVDRGQLFQEVLPGARFDSVPG